jgi:mannan endo-1,4-beta-mannosidase
MKNILFVLLFIPLLFACDDKPRIQVDGKTNKILDPCGEELILRGVNKMVIFDDKDPYGKMNFEEIAKTNANCVRIVWGMKRPNLVATTPVELDSVITNCINNQMIPIVGLWDYTDDNDGGFSKLNEYIEYWTRPEIVKVVLKHQGHLIINIGNEAGDELNEDDLTDFNAKTSIYVNAYNNAVTQIRSKGIFCPLIIDGLDRGKSLKCFSFIRQGQSVSVANELLNNDSRRNLIFSAHTYWPANEGATEEFIDNKFQEAIKSGFPFIIGEISEYGSGSDSTKICNEEGRVNYKKIAKICQDNKIGWMVWEWGPGNESKKLPFCGVMDMTTNSKFNTLKGTGKDLVENPEYGLLTHSKVNRWAKLNFIACPKGPDFQVIKK